MSPRPYVIQAKLVEENAASNPNGIFCEVLESNDPQSGTTKVTWAQTLRATDRLCWWLDENLGRSGDFGRFTYLSESDPRYGFIVFAAMKTQRVVIITDNRLTPDALVTLLQSQNCRDWVGSTSTLPDVEWLSTRLERLRFHTMPTLEELLEDGEIPSYPYTKSWEEASNDPFEVLHTSGTTGSPKAVVTTHAMLNMQFSEESWHAGDEVRRKRCLWTAPMQWLGGLVAVTTFSVFHEMIAILPPIREGNPKAMLTSEDILSMLQACKPQGAFLLPSTVKQLLLMKGADDQDSVEFKALKALDVIVYAGAPLDRWVGDALCEHVELNKFYGSVDQGLVPCSVPDDRKDWMYFKFPRSWNIEGKFVEDSTELYELVAYRKKGPNAIQWCQHFVLHPEDDEVNPVTDVFTKHPTKEDHYLYAGRSDDLFKLSWLAKVKATDVESLVEKSPLIERAFVGGQGEEHPFLLVQTSSPSNGAIGRDAIWDVLEQVNAALVAEVRIPRSHILIADQDRPLPVLSKGTLDRPGALRLYEKELSTLYNR